MSLIFTESFVGADFGAGKWSAINNVLVQGDATARTNGVDAYSGGATPASIIKQVDASDEHVTFVAGFAIKQGTVSTATPFDVFGFLSDSMATLHVTIQIAPGSAAGAGIYAYRGGSSGTLLGSYAGTVLPLVSTWYYLEAKCTLSDTVGVVTVSIDGTTLLSLTGVDTKNGGTKSTLDSMSWKLGSGVALMYLCDLYLCNGAGSVNNGNFLNCPRIFGLWPTSDGTTIMGVGSDGDSVNNSALVQEHQPTNSNVNTTTYVDFVNTGDKDTYNMVDISGLPTTNQVYGVVAYPNAQKTDAGVRTLTNVARLSGVETTAPAAALNNGSYRATRGVFETKPGGGSWTVADVNNAEFGMQAST
jgi:hypothetical protein